MEPKSPIDKPAAMSADLLDRIKRAMETSLGSQKQDREFAERALSRLGAPIIQSEMVRLEGLRREKQESRQREEDMVSLLAEILRELQQERQAREQLEAKFRAHDQELVRLRTGAPGRRGSSHLVVDEFKRRMETGDIEDKLADQARVLNEWKKNVHPDAAPLTDKTVMNKILPLWRESGRGRNRKRSSRTPKMI